VTGAIVPTICTRRPTHELKSLPVRRYPFCPAPPEALDEAVPPGVAVDGDGAAVTDVDPVVPAADVPAPPMPPVADVPVVPTPVVPVVAVPDAAAPAVDVPVAEVPLVPAPVVPELVDPAAEPAAAAPGVVGVEKVDGGADAGVVGVLVDVAEEATLPGCDDDGAMVGLIIVIGPEPTPPPTQPDIVIVPVAADPAVCGIAVVDVVLCANTVADVAANAAPSSNNFISFSSPVSNQAQCHRP